MAADKSDTLDKVVRDSARLTIERLDNGRGKNKVSRSFYIDPDRYKAFKKICGNYDTTNSNIIELLIKCFIEEVEKKKP